LVVPDLIMRALFMRGAFTATDAHAAAMTLVAYTTGLVPFVLIRSVVAPFLARGDTKTPVKAALIGTGVNIMFKIALMVPLAQVGLALATSIGAWINFILVLIFAVRARVITVDADLKASLVKLAVANAVLALVLILADPLVTSLLSSWSRFRSESELVLLALIGAVVYGGLVIVLFGRRWLLLMRRGAETAPAVTLDQLEGTSPAAGPDPA
jgi:putative peptidoglycan lipid II flippase